MIVPKTYSQSLFALNQGIFSLFSSRLDFSFFKQISHKHNHVFGFVGEIISFQEIFENSNNAAIFQLACGNFVHFANSNHNYGINS